MLYRSQDERAWLVSQGRALPATASAWAQPHAVRLFVVTRLLPHAPGTRLSSGVFLCWSDALHGLLMDFAEHWLMDGWNATAQVYDFTLPKTRWDLRDTLLQITGNAAIRVQVETNWGHSLTVVVGDERFEINEHVLNQERQEYFQGEEEEEEEEEEGD